mgnify:CR=1 FL=1
MLKVISIIAISLMTLQIQASPNQMTKAYDNDFKTENEKIKSCLTGLYNSQIQFRRIKGYFATLPNELKLNKYEISTHYVSDSAFKMTAKFNRKIWLVDQSKTIRQLR